MSPIENPTQLVLRLIDMPAETEWLEFKHNNADPIQIGRNICALSNAAALHEARFAYKIWGIDDAARLIVGTSFDPLTATKGNQPLEHWLRLKLSPNVQFEFERALVEGKAVVILRIWPAMYQLALFDNKAYMRSGSSTHELVRGSAQETELWRKVQHEDYESQPSLTSVPIDEALELLDYPAYFQRQGMLVPETRQTVVHYLMDDGILLPNDDGTCTVTNLGALLFARDLSAFPSVARKAVRVIQYDGNGRISMLRSKTFMQGYVVCADGLIAHIMDLLPSQEVIEHATRVTKLLLPEVAIRELVMNALIHQELFITGAGPMVELFTSRAEITNPGTPLVDPMRIVNDPPRARNERMAALMRRLGLCEEAGSGWDKVIEACDFFHLPAPRLETPGDNTQVTLFAHVAFRDLMPEERRLACYWHTCIKYASKSAATNQSLRERFDIQASSSSQISRLIRECTEEGLIKPIDPIASKKNMRYIPAWV